MRAPVAMSDAAPDAGGPQPETHELLDHHARDGLGDDAQQALEDPHQAGRCEWDAGAMAATSDERVCVVCGASLDGRRPHALTDSERCARERRRLLAILDGRGAPPYRSVRARVGAANNPANGATGGTALTPRVP